MSDKRKRELRDDDGGLRTPTRKRSKPKADGDAKPSRSKSEASSSKSKSKSGSVPSARKSGSVPSARKSGTKPAREPGRAAEPAATTSSASSGGSNKNFLALLAVLFVVGGAAAGVGFLFLGETPQQDDAPQIAGASNDKPEVAPERFNANATPSQVGAAATPEQPQVSPGALRPQPLQPTAVEPGPGQDPAAAPKGNPLDELRTRSPDHEQVARILDEFQDLFSFDGLSQNPMFDEFQQRRQREEELIARLRALGPYAVGALKDMVLGLNNRAHQIFLAKGLAGIEGPETLNAVRALLGESQDVALQTTLVRFLPDGDAAAGLVRDAYAEQQNPTARTMLLREFSRRTADNAEADVAILRDAALQDSNANVRSEAISILGRRGSPEDAALMERIVREESNLQLRQRAVVAYGETGGQGTLDTLEGFMRDPNTPVRLKASTVLAISRVGGDRAISSLDLIAQSDANADIRSRAQKLANSLRARRDNPAPDLVDEEPLILGPGQQPLR